MQKRITIPCDFTQRVAVRVVQGLSLKTGAPLYGIKDNRRINFNSILGVLSLNIKKDEIILFESEDKDRLRQIEDILFSLRY